MKFPKSQPHKQFTPIIADEIVDCYVSQYNPIFQQNFGDFCTFEILRFYCIQLLI
jgi:hypothetical protein